MRTQGDVGRPGHGPGPQRQALRPAAGGVPSMRCRDRISALSEPGHLGRGPSSWLRITTGWCVDDEAMDALLQADRGLRRPEVPVHRGSLPRRRRSGWRGSSPDRPGAGRRRSRATSRLVHDLGRMGVPNSVWEKSAAADRVRPGARPPLPLPDRPHPEPGPRAGSRGVDRGGPPRTPRRLGLSPGLSGSALADDATESWRPPTATVARSRTGPTGRRPDEEQAAVQTSCRGPPPGRLDAACGRRRARGRPATRGGRRFSGPAGLTTREVEVLGLVARGCTSAEIAHGSRSAPRRCATTSSTSTSKAGVSNRAGAALFAMEHGLVSNRRRWGTCPMTPGPSPATASRSRERSPS